MIDTSNPELLTAMNDLVIRQVDKADLPALEWDGEYLKYRLMYANLYRNTQSGKTLMWVIQVPQGEIIGQAFVMLQSNERSAADGRHRAYVFAFRIKPAWRNRGIGTCLMDYVEKDLRRRGYKFVTLNVAKENPDALRLYKRLGYKVTGSQPGIWSFRDHTGKLNKVEEPAWRMIKRLDVD
jgi:ribosomal protein S18 acetylase RimI-like enzyme